MRSRYKISEQHGWYFVTSTTIQWIPLFTNQNYFDIILTSLKFSQLRKDLKIYAFVIMDNHFHAILQHSNLSGAMQSIKSYTAGRIIKQLQIERKSWALDLLKQYKQLYKTSSNYQIWQEGFHPQLIENDSILTQKIEYIHHNPVKRGWVDSPEAWRYSSARYFEDQKGLLKLDIEWF